MPWRELKPMDLKVMFIAEYLSEKHSFSRLCEDYQISRKTGYKWVERYQLEGPSGLDVPDRVGIPAPARYTTGPFRYSA